MGEIATMPRIAAVAFIVAVLLAAVPGAANAQPCNQAGIDLADLAGVYISSAHQMRVEVWPCGGFDVMWDNPAGRHRAAYAAVRRFEAGGVLGQKMDGYAPVTLDNANGAAVTPAEPGWVNVTTASPYGDIRVYRLRKIA